LRSWTLKPSEVLAPKDFEASAISVGLKQSGLDLALLVSTRPSFGAAMFTTNAVKAAPVQVSQRYLQINQGRIRAVIVNSGNANACTGPTGIVAAEAMASATANLLGIPVEQVLVCSTGVIGTTLPLERIITKTAQLKKSLSVTSLHAASEAILTTDTINKVCTAETLFGGTPVRITGMTKGAGMIHPQMATTLGFVLTDACITHDLLKKALSKANQGSYQRISVDGDTSTNDTLAIIANGGAGAPSINQPDKDYFHFVDGLTQVCQSLAQQIVRDGEGATKFVTIRVNGLRSEKQATRVARAIANSPLVKTAISGEDPNWGRILCAAGYAGVPFDANLVSIALGGLPVCLGGEAVIYNESHAQEILRQEEIELTIDFQAGSSNAIFWTCDLTKEYIHINADYRT